MFSMWRITHGRHRQRSDILVAIWIVVVPYALSVFLCTSQSNRTRDDLWVASVPNCSNCKRSKALDTGWLGDVPEESEETDLVQF